LKTNHLATLFVTPRHCLKPDLLSSTGHCGFSYRVQILKIPELTDGRFAYQKIPFWGNLLEGFGKETFGIFYTHLAYFMVIYYILLG
jgi:hypothetical protein